MAKSNKPTNPEPQNKGFLELAGEALHVLGQDIAEGKDKVVEVASEKITVFKQAVGKIIHKKGSAKPAKKKAASKKKAPPAKKSAPKKKASAVKKAPPKAAVKKNVPAKKKVAAKKKPAAPKKVIAKKKGTVKKQAQRKPR